MSATKPTETEEVGTELVEVPRGAVRLQQRPMIDTINETQLRLIASQIAPNCSRAEIGHFLELCVHYDLDPFAKEVWCAKSTGQNARLLIMVGRDGLRKIAKRQGLEINADVVRAEDTYEVEFVDNEADAKKGEWEANGRAPFHRVTHKRAGMGTTRGAIAGAWCRVRNSDREEVGFFEAPIGEYKPSDGRRLQYSPWGSQESVMILAAAERQALRQATPLGGLLAIGEDARVTTAVPANDGESARLQELSDEEVAQIVRLIGETWSDEQAQMELVAAGASDVSSVDAGVRSLARTAVGGLVERITQDQRSETPEAPTDDGESPVDAEVVDE